MISRRSLIAGTAAGGLLALCGGSVRAEPIMTDDGYYTEPWFLESFLELPDDLSAAAGKGKRFAIMWELRGCPYCKETHLVNFAKPEISSYIQQHFEVLQLNILGSREVVDFDGEKLAEKQFARKYGVRATPTFQFFPDSTAGLKEKSPRNREVSRFQGYLPPSLFLAAFRFVAERAYERDSLGDYLRANWPAAGSDQ
jgi:thioredoxin-related protein